MALPTVADCKDVLRVETTAEDALITGMLARAKALIEGALGYPLTSAATTHTNFSERDNYGQRPTLTLPGPFKTSGPAPVVTDVDGNTVDDDDYTLDPRGMMIRAIEGVRFDRRPYTVAATIGLSEHPDYASKLELIASMAIIDLVVHMYRQRNMGVAGFTEEGGGGETLAGQGRPTRIPDGVMDTIDLLPGRNGGMILS